MKRPLTVLAFAASFAPLASAGSLEKDREDSAFAGQAIAIGWAAESCRGNELSKSEREACAVLGAGGNAEDPKDSGYWLPVFLKCPDSKDNGALISIDENLKGEGRRIIVNYRSGRAESVQVVTANTNSSYGKGVTISFDTETKIAVLEFIRDVANSVNPLNDKICNADSRGAKKRYDQIAQANRNKLHAAAPDNFRKGTPGRNLQAIR